MEHTHHIAGPVVRWRTVFIALVAAGCRAGASAPPVQPASTGCLSQDAITAAASPPGDPTDETIRKKLEAPLRQLYDDLMGAARRTGSDAAPVAPAAPAESGACIPERVGATVSFTGPRADLEAAGFDIASVFADPERDVSFASGSIASVRIRGLAMVSHVRFIYGAGEVVPARSRDANARDAR